MTTFKDYKKVWLLGSKILKKIMIEDLHGVVDNSIS